MREVESQAARGKVNAQNRTKFQVSALLVREERQRVKDDASVTAEQRAEVLKRLDGLAAIMAKTAAKDTSLITLLAPEAKVSDSAKRLRRDFLVASGAELPPEDLIVAADTPSQTPEQAKQVVPESVRHAQLANPFMAPRLCCLLPVEWPG